MKITLLVTQIIKISALETFILENFVSSGGDKKDIYDPYLAVDKENP